MAPRSTVSFLLTALVVLLPAAARAQELSAWVNADLAFHTYDMSAINELVGDINRDIWQQRRGAESLDAIRGGFGLGIGGGLDLSHFSIGFSYERLMGSTKVTITSGQIELRVPSNLFLGQAVYRVDPDRTFTYGFGAAAGVVTTGTALIVTEAGDTSRVERTDFGGSHPAFAVFVTGEWSLSDNIAVVPVLGYLNAKIEDVDVEGVAAPGLAIDYSGLAARVRFKVRF